MIEMKSNTSNFLAIFFVATVITLIVPIVNAENSNTTSNITPFINIDPIGNHTVGDVIIISGTTNLPVTDNLTVDIITTHWFYGSGHMKNTPASPPPDQWAFFPSIPIEPDFQANKWSVNITDNATHLIQGEYFAFIEKKVNYPCTDPEKCNIGNYSEFSLLPTNNSTSVTVQSSLQITQTPTSMEYSTTVPTRKASPVPLALSIVAIFAGIALLCYSKNKRRW
jgi:hypothetical protein